MKLIDTHCHIGASVFQDEIGEVVNRARAAGLGAMLNLADDLQAAERAIELASTYHDVFAAVGIHPHEALSYTETTEARLRELAGHPKVVAIGEIGLDYHYDFAPKSVQHDVFRRQIRLARSLKLPIAVHNRLADDDVLDILTEERAGETGGVLHCFWGGEASAKRALDLGFYLGVGGPITFKNTDDLRGVLKTVPLDRLIVETDSPYLAPVPYRGKQNEPAYVVEVAKRLSSLFEVSLEDVIRITTTNANRLFGFGEI